MDKPKKQSASGAAGQGTSGGETKAAPKRAAKAAASTEPAAPKALKKGTKSTAAKKPQPAPAGAPVVDTGLAAATAARMLAHRAAGTPASVSPAGEAPAASSNKESSTFQKLKNNLTNPAAGLSNVLGGPIGQKKSHNAFGPNQQINRNQGFGGGGGNRLGVPRRTSGG